jgi:integrase
MPKFSKAAPTKPAKPHRDFPLTPHPSGRWCKKVRGKLHYFGPWNAPDAALAKWLEQRDDLLAGRTPRVAGETLTVADLCNRFLTAKKQMVGSGELSSRAWGEYYSTCETIVAVFGRNRALGDLRPDDFGMLRRALAKRNGPVRLGNEIQRVRTALKWAYDSEWIEKPVRTGPDFKKPAPSVVRKARLSKGPRMFEPHELQAMLKAASPQLRAMIYLGLNAGLGNTDCGSLRSEHVDLKSGWLTFPRPKTGIPRRCPLWQETIAALKIAEADRSRPVHKADSSRVFLTEKGLPWTADAKLKENAGAGPRVDIVTKSFRRLIDSLDLHRPGLGFYTLRHIFETIAGETTDQVAVDCIMGHADHTMAANYRERIDDIRLEAVTNHVHAWLFQTKKGAAKTKLRAI